MDETAGPAPVLVPLMDAAFALGLSYDQARRLLLQHKVKGARQGGHWFVDKADLERYARETLERSS